MARELERAAYELGLSNIPSRASFQMAIKRHEQGLVRSPTEFYVKVYCRVFGASASELFGTFSELESTTRDCFTLQSHKFIPAYVGPLGVQAMRDALAPEDIETPWTGGWRVAVDHPRGTCTLYGFPWGSLVYHVEEPHETAHVADVSVWRHHSYPREIAWARQHLKGILPASSEAPEYVLSAFWVDTPKWDGNQLETAMRLLCTPRVLLDREVDEGTLERARLAERAFLKDGYDNQQIVSFGTYGVSLGYASWAGVAYYPMTPRSALSSASLITLELVVQGLWCFCQHLRSQVEAGRDPEFVPEYGWRWLRGIRSKLTSAQPQETSQESSMRTAILQTSGLDTLLSSALEILRDAEREARP